MAGRKVFLPMVMVILSLTCGNSDSGKVRPVGTYSGSAHVNAETARQAEPAQQKERPAQRAWDTANPESFDVDELNRRNAERDSIRKAKEEAARNAVSPPLTREDTLAMLMKIKSEKNGAFSYLKPSEFPGLPTEIAAWLEEREYVIPQVVPPLFQYTGQDSTPCNAISGEFIQPGQTDWAVYCTNTHETRIFVFVKAKTDSIKAIGQNLRAGGELSCCYFWINPTSSENLIAYNELIEGHRSLQPPEMNHQGISIGTYNYGDHELFFSRGRWYVFESTDDE